MGCKSLREYSTAAGLDSALKSTSKQKKPKTSSHKAERRTAKENEESKKSIMRIGVVKPFILQFFCINIPSRHFTIAKYHPQRKCPCHESKTSRRPSHMSQRVNFSMFGELISAIGNRSPRLCFPCGLSSALLALALRNGSVYMIFTSFIAA